MSALISTRSLKVARGERTLIRSLDLELAPGSMVALLGPNGAGKSTLLHTLAGLLAPAAGQVSLLGDDIRTLSRRRIARSLGLLLQSDEDPFPATALDTALMGRHPHLGFWEWESPRDVQIARAALAAMDLVELESREVHTLSGGERRRLAMATLLAQEPALMLLDEPLDQLDPRHQHHLMQLLARLVSERGHSVVISMHDVNLASRYCDHALLVPGDGSSTFGQSCLVLDPESVETLYGLPIDVVEHQGWHLFLPR